MKWTAAAACFVLALMAPRAAAAQDRKDITERAVAAMQAWVNAVQSHEPGRFDSPVVALAALSYPQREELNLGMALFLETLLSRKINNEAGSADAQRIMALGRGAGEATSFLKRAAVLHADVAAYGDRRPAADRLPASGQEVRIPAGMGFTAIRPGENVSPLLRSDRLIVGQDGQATGETLASWNWPFARSLLELVVRRDANKAIDPFVGSWYHATMAYMFANGLYGDATPHLRDAERLLPNDARLLFDRGCYAELLGLPMHQEMLSAADIVEQRSRASAQDRGPQWRPPGSAPALTIPLAETTNADAERLYRRALTADPALIEARVRLARLLDIRKRHKDAAAELKTALTDNPTGVVGFYAHLFAGRTAQASGQADEAMMHYKEARSLFPDAQSALLALSQLSLLQADVPEALASLERLGGRSEVFTADPWWQYYLCSGRNADDLLTALWATVPPTAPR
jgi:tetratricopeptide (TPR) repeat protein